MADGVGNLGGIDANVGVGGGEAEVGHFGPENGQFLAAFALFIDFLAQPFDGPAKINEPAFQAFDKRPAEGADGVGIVRIGVEPLHVVVQHRRRGAKPFLHIVQTGIVFKSVQVIVQRQPFDGHAFFQGIGPADVGAPIQIVADPARHRQQLRRQALPVVGIGTPGDGKQDAIGPAERVPDVADGHQRKVHLVVQGDRVGGAVGCFGGLADQVVQAFVAIIFIAAAGQVGEDAGQARGYGKGRVRGDDDAEDFAFDGCLKNFKSHRFPISAPRLRFEQGTKRVIVFSRAAFTDITTKLSRPIGEGVNRHQPDQFGQAREVGAAFLNQAGNMQGDIAHRRLKVVRRRRFFQFSQLIR